VTHSRRRPRLSYDDLYLFFVRQPESWESSSIEWNVEDLEVQWTTVTETGCGMFLYRPPLNRECVYRCAPLNSVTFGRTGGDGIHYSFLVLDGHWSEFSPVVMTDPCGLTRNVVVGEDLTEFLRLGIRTGYFALPYHVPDEDGRFDKPTDAEPLGRTEFAEWVEPEMARRLQRLARRFQLQPLEDPARRLVELQRRYQPFIQRRPDRRLRGTGADVKALALARLSPGDAVIWDKNTASGPYPVKATVLAVTANRVTIAAEDPDETGAGVVTRSVSPTSLRFQQRGPTISAPLPAASGRSRRRGAARRGHG
jgi:hypothetical protein